MKYFFVVGANGEMHLLAAYNENNARAIAGSSEVKIAALYELTPAAFDQEGFLLTQK